ncbi:MAG: AAA family ATPase [bacterium]|nr:AAA family ATPase [bacterium]
MDKFSDYAILEKITENDKLVIYKGQKDAEEHTVIIKILKTDYSTLSEIARFKQECEKIKNTGLNGVHNIYDIIDDNDGIALIHENFNSISLKEFKINEEIDIKSFLKIAIDLSEIIGNLHKNNIVHKDIRPHNILINTDNNEIVLTNFGISSELTHENEELYNEEVIKNRLPYMSPEQTGRMNRTVDYRTDLYSLGITFYEVLTGSLPFESSDPLEIIHSHIARKPVFPTVLNQEIPDIISYIIMRLIAKTAEERYQNSFGLMADLKNCLQKLKKNSKIVSFELGAKDISVKFNIPQKLFGRENETKLLMSAFERTSKGNREIMFVSGFPGIGKSALINEIHKPIVAKRGYFISGKYEQFGRDTPYSAIILAFQGLVKQILSESKEMIDIWKENLSNALGPNGKVITDVIPDVEFIIGEQPDLSILGSEESQNRFNLVFKNFVELFSKEEHPLVLFLDDLQWADYASIQLMENLITDPNIKFLFLIGAYRDNEVLESHPLLETIENLERSDVKINNISLSSLRVEDINNFIGDFLRFNREKAYPLAELVHKKTNGNPFFVNQFMKTLYDDRVIEIDPVTGWQWDIGKINKLQMTDNVVNLMAAKITRLDENTQEILKMAACIGSRFDLETLSVIVGENIEEILRDVTNAVDEGLVGISDNTYIFSHDRIQEAVYSLIPEERKNYFHFKIGKLALENIGDEELTEEIFYIVNQLNFAIGLLSTQSERYELARLNYIAGNKAKVSAAYSPAFNYLKIGIKLLGRDCWEEQYPLAFPLYAEAAEVAYLNAEYDEMNKYSDTLLTRAKSFLDKVEVYEIKISTYIAQNRLPDAVAMALKVLNLLGIKFPKKPRKFHVFLGLLKAKLSLFGKKIENLIDLPEMNDPSIIVGMRIINSVMSAVYWMDPNLLALMSFKRITLSIKYGNDPVNSPIAYSGYGLILGGILEEFDSGYKFGQLALNLLERMNIKGQEGRVYFGVNNWHIHWKEHVGKTLKPLLAAHQKALESGGIEWGANALMTYCSHLYFTGKNLSILEKELSKYIDLVTKLKQETQLHVIKTYHQVVLNFLELNQNLSQLKGTSYNEEEMFPLHYKANDRTALFNVYFNKLIICFLFQEYEESLENAIEAENNIGGVTGLFAVPVFYFFESLALLAGYNNFDKSEKKRIHKEVGKNQKRMKKWAQHAPMNHLHRYYLIGAEIARVKNQNYKAMDLYKKAIKSAKENEFTQDEAIACELAAKFYLGIDYKDIAGMYMTKAYICYSRWGALAKLKHLEETYPDLIPAAIRKKQEAPTTAPAVTAAGDTSRMIDMSTIMKASHAVSTEIVLSRLLTKLMRLSMENAGAEKGYMILEEDGELYVEAEGHLGKDEVLLLKSIPVDQHPELSPAIVHYVERTKETVILKDAANEGDFTDDPFITEKQPKSILCFPLVNQGKIIGILYLENDLTTGAFTPERVEILTMIASEVAISIENARLYESLEEKVQERTEKLLIIMEEFEVMNENLINTNRELETAHRVARRDMEMASNVQANFLPKQVPECEDWEISYVFKPMADVSGDFYDFYMHEDLLSGVGIFDVSGHGISSGLITMISKSIMFRHFDRGFDDPINEVLYEANEALQAEIGNVENYITGVMLRLKENTVEYVNAGHPDIFVKTKDRIFPVVKEDGGSISGFFLGIADMGIAYDSITFQVEKGDFILLYTDCLNEATKKRKEYGPKRIIESFESASYELSAQEMLDHVLEYFYEYLGRRDDLPDDLTVMVLKRL